MLRGLSRNRPKRPGATATILIFTLLLAVALVTGDCNLRPGEQKPGVNRDEPEISSVPRETKQKIVLYFGDKQSTRLVAEERQVTKGDKSLEALIIEELIKGPRKPDLVRTVPAQTRLISVNVVDGVAFVNFSREFQTKHWGGTTGERMTLYSIINSLARLPGIDKVQFLLEGEKQEAILGHADTTKPLAPDWNLVDVKQPGQKVTLYFADEAAMYLVPEVREVTKGNEPLGSVVIEELLKGPRSSTLAATIPKGARLLSFSVVNGVAYVNFSREFKTGHPGGSAGERMTLYSIINSLARLPGIEKVQFLVEGEKQEAILGHADTTVPIGPDWSMVKE